MEHSSKQTLRQGPSHIKNAALLSCHKQTPLLSRHLISLISHKWRILLSRVHSTKAPANTKTALLTSHKRTPLQNEHLILWSQQCLLMAGLTLHKMMKHNRNTQLRRCAYHAEINLSVFFFVKKKKKKKNVPNNYMLQ